MRLGAEFFFLRQFRTYLFCFLRLPFSALAAAKFHGPAFCCRPARLGCRAPFLFQSVLIPFVRLLFSCHLACFVSSSLPSARQMSWSGVCRRPARLGSRAPVFLKCFDFVCKFVVVANRFS